LKVDKVEKDRAKTNSQLKIREKILNKNEIIEIAKK
jgi:hypothetical protein